MSEREREADLNRNRVWGAIIGATFVALAAAFVFFAGQKRLWGFFADFSHQTQVLVTFALASFFPTSAAAYQLFRRKTRTRKLGRDFWLLGIDIRDGRGSASSQTEWGTSQGSSTDKPENGNAKERRQDDASSDPWSRGAYSRYVEELYERSHASWNYAVQSTLAVLLTIIGMALFFLEPSDLEFLEPNTLQAMRYGFLGAYIFSAQLVYRRYNTLDLQPTVYMQCAITLFAGIAFCFVVFTAVDAVAGHVPAAPEAAVTTPESAVATPEGAVPTPESSVPTPEPTRPAAATAPETTQATGLEAAALAIVAFSLGYFPYLSIRWFNRVAYRTLGMTQRRSEALRLGLIDGISELHETRLRDEGIDNLQNLATVALDELLMNTRFSAQEVAEWVDQAILYAYLDEGEIESFRRGGVRTFTDFCDLWEPLTPHRIFENLYDLEFAVDRNNKDLLQSKDEPEKAKIREWLEYHTRMRDKRQQELQTARKERSLQLQSLPERLDALYLALQQGANVAHIEVYWTRAKDHQKDVSAALEEERRMERDRISSIREKRRELLQLLPSEVRREFASAGFTDPSEDYNYYLQQGLEYGSAGDYESAESCYREALWAMPNDDYASGLLAGALLRQLVQADKADRQLELLNSALPHVRFRRDVDYQAIDLIGDAINEDRIGDLAELIEVFAGWQEAGYTPTPEGYDRLGLVEEGLKAQKKESDPTVKGEGKEE